MTKTFIDLFAGIGGFHQAFADLGAKCVFASEIDENAKKTYLSNHKVDTFVGDINDIEPHDIPDHDILCAGFPCQPFSQAGFKKGFDDTRGTLFSNILNILIAKQPSAFFLENVRHLKKHDDGKTFAIIKNKIEGAGYSFYDFIVHAKHHGVPQFRPRLFMIGFKNKTCFAAPNQRELKITMSDILGGECSREIGFTLRVGGRGSGINSRHNWDSYLVDGEVRRLTVKQGAAMQGLPPEFIFPVSEREAMKQLGNSVAIPAVRDYAERILGCV
jgi:DNA (cytosine-5)-methyltransferase 1